MSDVSDFVPIVNSELAQTAALGRQCVANGWFDPIELHNAAYRSGLRGEQFTDPGRGSIYCYTVTVADLDRQPDPDECAIVVALTYRGPLWH